MRKESGGGKEEGVREKGRSEDRGVKRNDELEAPNEDSGLVPTLSCANPYIVV